MHALLETLPLPVIIRDAERRVTLVNAAWEKMLGIPRQEIVGKTARRRSAHRSGPTITARPTTKCSRPASRCATRPSFTARDGTDYNVIVAKTPLLAEDGTITGIASVVTDISEQKRIADVLERARVSAEAAVQAKSRFLANMSHELRTPLNGVVGMASLLENTALDAKQRRFVRTLQSSAEALITLINDVLDLSKAEAGKLELAQRPVRAAPRARAGGRRCSARAPTTRASRSRRTSRAACPPTIAGRSRSACARCSAISSTTR